METRHHISALGLNSPRKQKPLHLWSKSICKNSRLTREFLLRQRRLREAQDRFRNHNH